MVAEFIRNIVEVWSDYKANNLLLKKCENCEKLYIIIEKQRLDYQTLVKEMGTNKHPIEPERRPEHELLPVTGRKPWHIVRSELENKDRIEAERLAKEAKEKINETVNVNQLANQLANKKSIEELEKELGVSQNENKNANAN